MTKYNRPKERKIAIMGFRSVGKSSLTIQFVEGKFVDAYDPTIENTFTKAVRLRSQDFFVKLIDTAGQARCLLEFVMDIFSEDEYSIVPSAYSMDIHGYILVYSITSTKSFEVVKVIYEKLLDMMGQVNVPIILVGNKTDLHMERTVPFEEGKAVADSWNAGFLEASAKQNQSVQEVFNTMLLTIEKSSGNLQEQSKCSIS